MVQEMETDEERENPYPGQLASSRVSLPQIQTFH
jgi:hypothetical protein